MPVAFHALTIGACGTGIAEFVIMGLQLEVRSKLNITIVAMTAVWSSKSTTLRPSYNPVH